MAERRMFSKKITDDDKFMELSASAQALYLHLMMAADDDGFCNQVTLSMFRAHASTQDLASLLEKRYLYQFEDGVIVIRHWRLANALRKDRYTPTIFQKELAQLRLDEKGCYVTQNIGLPDGCQSVANRLPQVSIDKVSEDKESIGEESIEDKPKRKRFVPPTLDEVKAFILENNYSVDADRWFSYYEANGWKVGKNPMKDWKASIRYWQKDAKPKDNKPAEYQSKEDYIKAMWGDL